MLMEPHTYTPSSHQHGQMTLNLASFDDRPTFKSVTFKKRIWAQDDLVSPYRYVYSIRPDLISDAQNMVLVRRRLYIVQSTVHSGVLPD